jgi:hypothetical protein
MKRLRFLRAFTGLGALLLAADLAVAQTPEAGAPAAAPVPQVSPAVAEVVKLASSGVGDDVVMAYIRNSQGVFDLNADQLLYLKDVGLSSQVTTAMLDHDNAMKQQSAPAPAPAPEPQPQPAPQPQQQYAPQAAPSAAQPAAQFTQSAPPGPGPAAPAPAPQAAPPPTYVGSAPLEVSYFYNDLAPYGSWVDLAGVGWCWQPSAVVVTAGWRPYCNGGHWVWTDAGWFWQSDYSWGWAPFHYGRWYLDTRCGWVWLPGTTWGPAWVTWRTVGSTCGWAPLPPHADFVAGAGWRYNGVSVGVNFDFGLGVNAFAFVSFNNFCAPNLPYHCLPRSQTTVIYKQTTIVNNYVVNNNTFINRGVAYDRIAAASHVPVPRATVREGGFGGRPPAGGGGNVVYRAPLHAPAKPANMVAQKVDMGRTIQHTSINTLKYEPKNVPGSAASAFQHNTVTKGQPGNAAVNTRDVRVNDNAGKTQNFGNNPNNAGKTYQWSKPDKTTGATPSATVNKTFPQNNSAYQPATGAKETPRTITQTPGSQPQFGATDKKGATAGNQQFNPSFNKTDQFNKNVVKPTTPATATTPTTGSGQGNFGQQQPTYRWYAPKSAQQAAEIRSLPKTPAQTTPSGSTHTPGFQPNSSGYQQFKKYQ